MTLTTWYFNITATDTITYSNASTGKPAATSIVIIDSATQNLAALAGQSRIVMMDTDMPAQNIV